MAGQKKQATLDFFGGKKKNKTASSSTTEKTSNKDAAEAATTAGDKRKRPLSDDSEEAAYEDTTKKQKPLVADDEEDEEMKEAEAQEKEQKRESQDDKTAAQVMACFSTADTSSKLVLCTTFEACEATTKRLEITEYLVTLFVEVIRKKSDDLLSTLYMCINKLCPDYEGLELGIGESLLIKSIEKSTGRTVKEIQKDYHETGDLGTVAKNSKNSQRVLFPPKPLTVSHVFKTLKAIAKIEGKSSQNSKIDKIRSLLTACKGNEAKYLIRQLEGKLRIGLAEQTVLSALAHSVVLSKPESAKMKTEEKEQKLTYAVDLIKSVYNQLPSYDMIVPALLEYSLDELEDRCKMRAGIPLKPMLAHPTKSLTEVLDRFEGHPFTCEFKYDGERAQIHKLPDGSTKIYSRNSEDMSVRYPDVVEKLKKWVKPSTSSFILDCEAVAWDREKKCILPFQVLSTRKRKDVKEEEITVQVAIFAFDCLYMNGESLLQESLNVRRQKLREGFEETENEFFFARHMDTNNIEDIQTFLDVSIHSNCEGLMVKIYDGDEASYEPSKRSRNWLKVKKDYLGNGGVGDSMDLVVVGAFLGKGKRTKVYGSFLLACYDPESGDYQTVCKLGTGFSDENLKEFYEKLKDREVENVPRYYQIGDNPEKPDVWFSPKQVWEVKCADLSISPRYMAGVGLVDDTKGISLRFPRFVRIRDDKEPEDCTTNEQIVEFYQSQ
ncbi:ATP-dependent DNA ligase [Zychaea mexicana]|uniref:ATP-dependent DNA ligase n=1 Tax=Zychaea mexicana TaxID=64656 RepID=UPI0022FEA1DC|nr:ATP-dependent DNA ligase [Zychaea mexicana]KAI9477143.1 ATP-dependent DNA ligase [Zychaea mexicana]